MNEYETTLVLRPDLNGDAIEAMLDRVRETIRGGAGKLLAIDHWGKKKLAYEIAKHPRGVFVRNHFLGNNVLVRELERILRINDSVLRYMTIRLAEKVDPSGREETTYERPQYEAEEAAAAAREAEEEARELEREQREMRGDRDRGDRGDRGDRDRGDRGDRDRGDRGPSDRGPSDRGDRGPSDRGPSDRGPSDRSPSDRGPSDRGPGDRGDRGPSDGVPSERGERAPSDRAAAPRAASTTGGEAEAGATREEG